MQGSSKRYLSKEEELALIDRYMMGDNDAWGIICSHFEEALRGYIRRKIGNPESAKDIAQECFMMAATKVKEGKYDNKYRIYTFLRAIARYRILRFDDPKDPVISQPPVSSVQDGKEPDFEDSFPPIPPDDWVVEVLEMFWLLSACCGKPHHILCLLFRDVLEWKPGEIVSELGPKELNELAEKFIEDYLNRISPLITKEQLEEVLAPLLDKIGKEAALVYPEEEYRECIEQHANGTPSGKLALKEFFRERSPNMSISDWCNKLINRAKKTLKTGILCVVSEDTGVTYAP